MHLRGLVSVVIPVHERPALLREAVASVLAQTHRPIEVVIVDDGSADDTPVVAAELSASHPDLIRWVRRDRPGGPGVAREAGRRAIRGEFVQWLDSDDLLHPRKFEWQVAELRLRPECGIAYGRSSDVMGPGASHREQTWRPRPCTAFPAMLTGRLWDTFVPLYRWSLLEAAGPWLPLRNEEDWEYDCRVAALGVRLAFVDEVVGYQRHFAHSRLSVGGSRDPRKLRHRAIAHERILAHARCGGVDPRSPEMRHFERELFLLSRQCGAAGLPREARRLFDLARSVAVRPNGIDYRISAFLGPHIGWRAIGVLSREADRMRALLRAAC